MGILLFSMLTTGLTQSAVTLVCGCTHSPETNALSGCLPECEYEDGTNPGKKCSAVMTMIVSAQSRTAPVFDYMFWCLTEVIQGDNLV